MMSDSALVSADASFQGGNQRRQGMRAKFGTDRGGRDERSGRAGYGRRALGLCVALARAARATGGNVALIFALAMPMVAILAAGGIEVSQVVGDRHRTQDVADAAAIDGAQQLSVTSVGATDRAIAYAKAQLADMTQYAQVTVSSVQVDKATIKVAIDTHRMSFFGNLLPPGGFFTHAEATAVAEGLTPLCVLVIGATGPAGDLHLTGSAKLSAPQCMVHGNDNVNADPQTALSAQTVEAGAGSTGPITPAANTGAKTIADPFTNISLLPSGPCNAETTNFVDGNNATLAKGMHCSNVTVKGGGTLTLAPGTHWFKAALNISSDGSSVDGTSGVTLVFLAGSTLQMGGKGATQNLNLKGATSGPLAGFVLATARDYGASFPYPSDNIGNITGTIYTPATTLAVNGASMTGQSSPWTVVVAQGVTINQSSNIIVNANYAASDVPVPMGVGTKLGVTTITR